MLRITMAGRFLIRSIMRSAITANYYLDNYKNVILVSGDGRSGTTWVSNLINHHGRYRYMFEPFHPHFVEAMRQFQLFQYIRPESSNDVFAEQAHAVFTGQFQHGRVDAHNQKLLFRGLLIKDIYANLFLKWVDTHFPQVKKILVVRHPCAVAVSKRKLKNWSWMVTPRDFLSQKELFEDFLIPFEKVINDVNGFLEKQVLIWCIVHYVPFKQLNNNNICLMFYEQLCATPERELERLFAFLGDEVGMRSIDSILTDKFRKPSGTTRKDSLITTNKDLIRGWRKEVSKDELARALAIVRAFGLAKLYGDDCMPNLAATEDLLGASRKIN